MQIKTQKEYFLKYLESLDVEMLDLIIDDSMNCFGASKQVFLDRLNTIVADSRGDKNLWRLKKHKRRQNIYYLVILPFSYSVKFILEENEGNIISLRNPKILKTREDAEKVHSLDLYFGKDEKIGFKPTIDYLLNLYNCTKAYEEFVNDKDQFLTSADISDWLNRHAFLYEDVNFDYLFFKFKPFINLYMGLEFLNEQLQFYHKVMEALDAYSNENEDAILKWLDDYEILAYCDVISFSYNFSDIDYSSKKLRFCSYMNIYFQGEDFFSILKFTELYFEHVSDFQYLALLKHR